MSTVQRCRQIAAPPLGQDLFLPSHMGKINVWKVAFFASIYACYFLHHNLLDMVQSRSGNPEDHSEAMVQHIYLPSLEDQEWALQN